jgi:ribosomal protein L3 glutamine methyltransferase
MPSSAIQELFTVRDLIRYGVSRFNAADISFGHGSDNAYDESVYLVLHSLHLPADTLEPFLDARILSDECERILALFERRVTERLPAAYLTQEAWLAGYRFYIDERVIVPRSPISELLSDGLSPWVSDPHAVQNVLDMCTGSGCLAILAALAFPDAHVDGVDISPAAIEVAQKNIDNYHLQARMLTHQSDLFSALPARHYDVIICNPPYVNTGSMEQLPQEFQREPSMALAGGVDGMDVVRRILKEAPNFMTPDAILVVEIGHEKRHFEAAFPELDPVWLETAGAGDQILLLTREQLAL